MRHSPAAIPTRRSTCIGGANPAECDRPIFGGVFYGPGFSREQVMEAQLDGPFFTLPGGALKLAVGGQWRHDELLYGLNNGPPGEQLVIRNSLHRHSDSAFAELLVPIVGNGNALPGIHRLDLDIAGRYEDYSDFGSTSHPKIGMNWSPLDNSGTRQLRHLLPRSAAVGARRPAEGHLRPDLFRPALPRAAPRSATPWAEATPP